MLLQLFQWAATNGRFTLLKALLKIEWVRNNAHDENNFAIVSAASSNYLQIVKELLKIEAVRNNAHAHHNAVLNVAIDNGDFALTEYLLSIGGVRSNAHANNNHALQLAATKGDAATVKILLEIDAVRNNAHANDNHALQLAAAKGDVATVKILLEIEAVRNNAHVNNNNALRLAITKGDLIIIEALLKALKESNLNIYLYDLIKYAAKRGQHNVVYFLAKHIWPDGLDKYSHAYFTDTEWENIKKSLNHADRNLQNHIKTFKGKQHTNPFLALDTGIIRQINSFLPDYNQRYMQNEALSMIDQQASNYELQIIKLMLNATFMASYLASDKILAYKNCADNDFLQCFNEYVSVFMSELLLGWDEAEANSVYITDTSHVSMILGLYKEHKTLTTDAVMIQQQSYSDEAITQHLNDNRSTLRKYIDLAIRKSHDMDGKKAVYFFANDYSTYYLKAKDLFAPLSCSSMDILLVKNFFKLVYEQNNLEANVSRQKQQRPAC